VLSRIEAIFRLFFEFIFCDDLMGFADHAENEKRKVKTRKDKLIKDASCIL
jgi:hypothetical protein